MNVARLFFVGIGFFLLSGCATVNKPAFDKQTTDLSVSENSIVLLTVNMRNDNKKRYQPNSSLIVAMQKR